MEHPRVVCRHPRRDGDPPEEPLSGEAFGLARPRVNLLGYIAVGRSGDDDDGSRFQGSFDGGMDRQGFSDQML